MKGKSFEMLCRPQQGSLANLQTVQVENLWSRAQHIKRFWSPQNHLWNKEYSKCTLWVLPSCLSNFCFEFSKRVNSVIGLFRCRNSNVKRFWVVRLLVAKCTCHILLLLSHLMEINKNLYKFGEFYGGVKLTP